jgi:glycosyltransferase involved in cell wall biosynthesis
METYSVELVRELSNLCDLTVRRLPGREDGRPPSLAALFRFMFLSIAAIAVGRRFDAILVGDLLLWPLAFAARLFQPSAGLAIAAHGTDIGFTRRHGVVPTIYRRYLALGVKSCPKKMKVIANSGYTAECCRMWGFSDVTPLPLGVSVLSDDDVGAIEVQSHILFVGRLARRKGVGWFVDNVLPLLASELKLMVIGPSWDESEWSSISGNTRVVYGGVVTSRDVLRCLRRSALAVVVPNIPTGQDFEGFGLTALEAAADGGVLLASAIEGIIDAVVDGETGFLLPALDAEAWAKRISEISRWPHERRRAFVQRAQETVLSRFSWASVAQTTLKLCQDSIGGGDR